MPSAVSKDHSSGPARAQRILQTEFVKEALERLGESLGAREPFLLVTGEAGTGKTTLVRAAIERWGARATVAFVPDPALSRTELLEEIVRRFGGEPPVGASKPQLIASLEGAIAAAKSENRVPVVVIDDAHEISSELLGELRLLVNVSGQAGGPLEVVLAGLPALEARLADPAFEALRQRVGVQIVMPPYSAHQSRRFVHEIAAAEERDAAALFPKKTCRELHVFSQGVPRTLGTLAGEALRLARRAGEPSVSTARVREAAEALGFSRGGGEAAAAAAPTAARQHDPAVPQRAHAESRPAEDRTGARPAGRDDAPPAATDLEAASPGQAGRTLTAADLAPIPRPPHDPDGADELKPPGDPKKVSDWVGRFISPDEPRFGDLIGTGRAEFVDEFGATEVSEDPAVDEVLARLRRRRGRVLPRYRRGRRQRPEWLGTVALLLVIAAALVTLAGPTKRMIAAGMNAISASAERSAAAAAARMAEEQRAATASDETAADAADPQAAPAKEAAKPTARTREPKAEQNATRGEPSRAAAPEPYQPPAVPAAAAAGETNADPNQLWAVDVGRHADAGAAGMERERLVEATGLKGWLVHSAGGGYRVVLGIYSTHARAENGARILMGNGLVSDATVIPLPPRSQRQ